ncbi:hypothetical protein V6N13_047598 [Hibiscus sabdariffa]|uniref:Uncharacterized protein n=1 Tax=Hibiscus sabdariffa TaxID=183260 RepID=A0ABR2F4N7_9ROSI
MLVCPKAFGHDGNAANHTSSSPSTVSVCMSETIKVKGTTLALILLGMSTILALIIYKCIKGCRRNANDNNTDVVDVESQADNCRVIWSESNAYVVWVCYDAFQAQLLILVQLNV